VRNSCLTQIRGIRTPVTGGREFFQNDLLAKGGKMPIIYLVKEKGGGKFQGREGKWVPIRPLLTSFKGKEMRRRTYSPTEEKHSFLGGGKGGGPEKKRLITISYYLVTSFLKEKGSHHC